jgi:hypothetical protein
MPDPMPEHWPVPKPTPTDTWIVHFWLRIRGLMFQFLCLAAFGLPEIEAVHEKMAGQWDDFRKNIKDTLNQAGVVVSNMKLGDDRH